MARFVPISTAEGLIFVNPDNIIAVIPAPPQPHSLVRTVMLVAAGGTALNVPGNPEAVAAKLAGIATDIN